MLNQVFESDEELPSPHSLLDLTKTLSIKT